MNKLTTDRRAQLIASLVEGNSIRATARMTDTAFNTVLKFVADIGRTCSRFLDEVMVDLPCRRIQCDEIWQFCYAKEKNLPEGMKAEKRIGRSQCQDPRAMVGSVWTWIAIDADTKLVPAFHVGTRDAWCAYHFMTDLAPRLRNRAQLTTDGHKPYLEAVYRGFGNDIDYAMLVKLYGETKDTEGRYSPPACVGARTEVRCGEPDEAHISTSYVERQNPTMRMSMRRFTRLTNGFSKKCANLQHAIALHYTRYNFVRIHKTLRCTPAMEAGVANRLWSCRDIAALLERYEQQQSKAA